MTPHMPSPPQPAAMSLCDYCPQAVSTHIVCRKKELEELRELCLSWVAVFIQRLMEMDYKIH